MNKFLRDINIISILILSILLGLISLTGDKFYLYISSLFMIYSLYALSYNLLYGYAKLLSFGHGMFFATGAYITGLFALRIFKDPLIGLLISIISTIPFALLIGYITLRHTKVYFAILTLALSMFVYAILIKWRDVTGGSDGLVGIPKKGVIVDISSPQLNYLFILIFFVLSSLTLYLFINSSRGLLIKALVNEERLLFTGHNVLVIRLYAFMISGVVAALSGSLYAIFMSVITPDIAYWTFSAEPLIMTLLGGSDYYLGPLLGAAIYVSLTTALARFAEYWMLFLGITMIAIIISFRGGVLGALILIATRLKDKRLKTSK
jgi:branched-chain amino acid transport system permease protein